MTAERQAQQAARPGMAEMPTNVPSADQMAQNEPKRSLPGYTPRFPGPEGAWADPLAKPPTAPQAAPPPTPTPLPPSPARSGGMSRTAPPRPAAPIQQVQRDPSAPPAQPQPAAAQWNPRTVTSRGGYTMTGEIAGYDNNAGSILMRRQDGSTIAVPHEEVDDETHTAAFNAPRYVADERDKHQITTKRATLKQQREAAAQPKPQAPRPQAAQPKPFFPPPKTAPTFDNNAPDQAHGGTLPPQLPKPQEPAPRPAAVQAPTPVRLTDNTGKHSFEGNVVSHDHQNNVVTIVGADGRRRYVHTSRLGEGTMNYVRGLELPHTAAPEDHAKAVQPKLAEGHQRFRLTDGQQVDGQITGHDPSTRTVNIRRPDGRVVSVDVDSLDEPSRGQYDSRVNEHAERVQFDNEKKAYEKEHGPGSHRFRQGAVVHTNGRSVLIPPGAKFGTDAATPEQGPIADTPPAARKAAEGVVATPPGQQEAGVRPGLPKRESGAEGNDDEQFDRDSAVSPMSRADTQSRLRSGQGFANVEQQGPLVDTGLTDEIMRRRGDADAKDRAQMRDMVDAQNSQPKKRSAVPTADVRKKWFEAVHSYRANPHLQEKGITLEDYADQIHGAGFHSNVPLDARDGAQNSANNKRSVDTRTKNARNNWQESQMTPQAKRAAANRTLTDPNSTPDQKAAALIALGQEDAARDIIRGKAQEGVAGALPDPAGKGDGKEVTPELPQIVDNALNAMPEGSTIEEQTEAGAHAIMQRDKTSTREEAIKTAGRVVQRRAWLAAQSAGPGTMAYGWLHRLANRLDENGQPVQGKAPMSQAEFEAAAYANAGIPRNVASAMWRRFVPQQAGTTRIGMDDSSRVE